MGSHFNISWRWTDTDRKKIFEIIKDFPTPLYHICNGMSNLGDIRLDRTKINTTYGDKGRWREKYIGCCNVLGDMKHLPFKSGVAGSVVCDPPYDIDFTNNQLISEIVRICKPKGKILFIAPWIPNHKNISVINTELWSVGKRPYHKVRTLFYKSNAQLDDYS